MASNSVGFMQGSEPSQAAAAHDFWDTVLSPTDSSPVRAPQGQRLRPAPPIEGSFVWNAGLSLQDQPWGWALLLGAYADAPLATQRHTPMPSGRSFGGTDKGAEWQVPLL